MKERAHSGTDRSKKPVQKQTEGKSLFRNGQKERVHAETDRRKEPMQKWTEAEQHQV